VKRAEPEAIGRFESEGGATPSGSATPHADPHGLRKKPAPPIVPPEEDALG
jgi:hypothetical protein